MIATAKRKHAGFILKGEATFHFELRTKQIGTTQHGKLGEKKGSIGTVRSRSDGSRRSTRSRRGIYPCPKTEQGKTDPKIDGSPKTRR